MRLFARTGFAAAGYPVFSARAGYPLDRGLAPSSRLGVDKSGKSFFASWEPSCEQLGERTKSAAFAATGYGQLKIRRAHRAKRMCDCGELLS